MTLLLGAPSLQFESCEFILMSFSAMHLNPCCMYVNIWAVEFDKEFYVFHINLSDYQTNFNTKQVTKENTKCSVSIKVFIMKHVICMSRSIGRSWRVGFTAGK